MRPLRLTFQAFGSYPGLVDIDFVALGQHGVFSITGDTGSGKTTIFDAMVYALYGELPGKRVPDDVRSHFARADVETYVAFEFEVKSVAWRIERYPRQQRPKQRGTGTTEVAARGILREIGRDTGGTTALLEMTSEVGDIIGLNCRQFQQVVLLPQGEFEAVLKAETKERVELLRKLFPVGLYKDFIDYLKTEVDQRWNEFQYAEGASRTARDGIENAWNRALENLPIELASPLVNADFPWDPFVESTFLELRKELSLAVERFEETVEQLREASAKAVATQSDAARQAAAFDKWVNDKELATDFPQQEADDGKEERLLNERSRLASLLPALNAYDEAERDSATAEARFLEARSAVHEVWFDDFDRTALDSDASFIELRGHVLLRQNALEVASRGHAELLNDEVKLVALEQQLATDLERLGQVQTDEEADLEALRTFAAAVDHCEPLMEALAGAPQSLEQARVLVNNVKERERIDAELKRQAQALSKRKEDLAVLLDELAITRQSYRNGLAGELALALVDGQPCPTCGACEHPAPAVVSALRTTSEDVERREDSLTSLRSQIDEAQSHHDKLAGQRATLTMTESLSEALALVASYEEETKELHNLTASVKSAKEGIADRKVALDDRKPALVEAQTFVTKLQTTVSAEAASLTSRKTAFEAAFGDLESFVFDNGQWSSFLQHLDDYHAAAQNRSRRTETLHQSLATLSPQLELHGLDTPAQLRELVLSENEIETRRSVISDRRLQRAQVAGAIAAYEAGPHPEIRPDPAAATEVALAAERAHLDQLETLSHIKSQCSLIDTGFTSWQQHEEQVKPLRQRYEESKTLSQLCAGQNSGRNEIRVALDEWVLSVYLNRVLSQANVRLARMTSGRYSLQVNSLGGDKRSRHGLDLEVFDTYTGKSRKARTLSGGETFKSALALALGLADVVSAGKNRELGALFIDEGFGSLDEDSLQQVLGILDSLQDGGRIVGVISHVDELKNTLPRGIDVVGTDEGSTVTIHYPVA